MTATTEHLELPIRAAPPPTKFRDRYRRRRSKDFLAAATVAVPPGGVLYHILAIILQLRLTGLPYFERDAISHDMIFRFLIVTLKSAPQQRQGGEDIRRPSRVTRLTSRQFRQVLLSEARINPFG